MNECYDGLVEPPLLQSLENIIFENVFSSLNLKILGYAGKKNDFELLRKFLLLRRYQNIVDERGKKR